ncbi:MAG: recombinase family protein [Dehalococcoidia bacterium]|nr:recombinase family protein [Dehalococcoidia bacterium]
MAASFLNRSAPAQMTFEDLRGLRAEGYVRDSKLDQQDGYGPDIQRQNEIRFAESYGLILGDRWYTEFVSGRSVKNRLEFRGALGDAAMDRYDVLLVDHTSRFGRNQEECIHYKRQLQDLNKVVVFVSQGIISGSERDFLAERINETLDEAYSRNLSRYVRSGFAAKAAQGHVIGHAPLGYRQEKPPSGRGARLVPDKGTMPALLQLLRGYASGDHSFRTLAQDLNAKGYRTAANRSFTESSISTALNNRFYEGKAVYHLGRSDEEVRDGAHKVPEDVRALWRRCQEVRQERAGAGRVSPPGKEQQVYPLTGVLTCDGCGEPFHGITHRSHGLRSLRMRHSWRRCPMRPQSVPAQKVETELAEGVLECLNLDNGWRQAVLLALAGEGPKPDNSVDIKRTEAALANLRKQHLWGVIGDEEFKDEYQALKRQIRALEPPPSQVLTPNLDRAAQLLQDLPALWHHAGVTSQQRRELAREVFLEVRLREGRLVAVKPRPQYAPLFAYSLWRQNDVGGKRSS